MNYNILYLLGEIPLPIIYLFVAISMWRSPPKMSENFGYRTRRSQSSEEAWNAAQVLYGKYSAIAFAITLAATITAAVTIIFINPDEDTSFVLFLVIIMAQVGVLISVIAAVEHKLKTLFDENGKPRARE